MLRSSNASSLEPFLQNVCLRRGSLLLTKIGGVHVDCFLITKNKIGKDSDFATIWRIIYHVTFQGYIFGK